MDDPVRLGLKKPDPADQLRGFGTGLTVILAVFALLSWHKGGRAAPWYALGGLVVGAVRLLRPSAFGPVYRPWMKVAGFIAEVNTTVVTALIYFLVLTPYAVVLKFFGRDALSREGDAGGWIMRDPAPDYKSYERQF